MLALEIKMTMPTSARRAIALIAFLAVLPSTLAFTPNVNSHASFRSIQVRTTHSPAERRPVRTSFVASRNVSLQAWNGPVADLVGSVFRYQGPVPVLEAFGVNAVLFTALQSKLNKMLTPTGFAHSLALGTMLWQTLGWRGWTLCVAYLFLGQAVTKLRFADKEKRGIAESRGGRRGPENVWGSALTALICASCASQGDSFLGLSAELYQLGYVAALATKLSDTFASEIGKAYGKTTFLITTLERVEPGTEGAVSAEGTAAALVGGSLLPLYGWAVGLINAPSVVVATFAAFVACNVESLIGATLQEKEGFKWMTNEVVNFINTLVGGGLALAGGSMFLAM